MTHRQYYADGYYVQAVSSGPVFQSCCCYCPPLPSNDMLEGSNICFYALWLMVPPLLSHHLGPLANEYPLHSPSSLPTTTGTAHKFVTVSCVLILVQLNTCVLHRGIMVMGVRMCRFSLCMNVGWRICLF